MIATRAANGLVKYFHHDHLGTPRLITRSTGASLDAMHYYPYGGQANTFRSSTDELRYKFTGHERDRNGEFSTVAGSTDYMLGRTYGYPFFVFMQVDPARDGWNLYGYVGGNPVRFTDPTGLQTGVEVLLFPGVGGGSAVATGGTTGTLTVTGGGLTTGGLTVTGGGLAGALGPGLLIGGGLGYAVNQIPGVSEALTIPGFSDLLSEGILILTRNRPRPTPDNRTPPPAAVPGARPRTTPAPPPVDADSDDPQQPDPGKNLQDTRKKTIIEKLVEAAEVILDSLGGG